MKLPHLRLLALLPSITTGSFAQPKNPRIFKADAVHALNNKV
ncbi:MAG: hypothetical protein ACJZ7A_07880 [Opitutales bacterium]